MQGRVVVSGVGNTAYGKHPGRSKIDLVVEAAREAVADAGIDKGEIDGVFVKMANASPEILYGQKVSEALGLQPVIGCALDQGGAANIGLITYAALAIEAGMIRNALICYGDTARTGSHAVYHRPRGDDAIMGWYSTAAGYAMIHQAYRQRYGARDEHFGAVAVAARAHGAQNPRAHLRLPLSMDDYLAGAFVVEPLRRDDICLVSDGGAAILLTGAAEAKRPRRADSRPRPGPGKLGGPSAPRSPRHQSARQRRHGVRARRHRPRRDRFRPALRLLHGDGAADAGGLRPLPARPGRGKGAGRGAGRRWLAALQYLGRAAV
jgi:acetyl-CoA acetyltransferase